MLYSIFFDIFLNRGKKKKKMFIFLILTSFIFRPSVYAEDLKLAENAKSAILIEASTGQVLFEKNADERLVPASMTKMMSMLIIIEAIERGDLKWNQEIQVSENASGMGGSQILLETGEKMTVRDLFKGVAVASGNDAVVALSEAVAGTEDAFALKMNERARELGLKNTNFKNPHGLDTANHYSSARDMALIAKELVKHKKVLEFTSIYEDYLRENTDRKIWLVNTNKLIRFYDGVDGLKTGYTEGAGYCLTATALKNGMRVIAVVMGEPDSKMRNKEVSEMLDYAFAQYEVENLLDNGYSLGKYKVYNGTDEFVSVVPKDGATVLRKKGEKRDKATYEASVKDLKAPLKKGEVVGELKIKENGKVIRKVKLTVNKNIGKINYLNLWFRNVRDMVTGRIVL